MATSTYMGLALAANDAGAFDIDFSSTSATADQAVALTVVDSGNHASGYAAGYYVNATISGSNTGGFASTQWNAFAADITLDGLSGAAGYGGGYIYIAKSGTFTDTSAVVYGFCTDIQEIGQVDYLANLWLQNSSTNASTGVNAYILFSNQGASGGKNTGMFYVQGINFPAYFLKLQDGAGGGMLSAKDLSSGTIGHSLLCYIGSTAHYIPLYDAT
jgi:hypothetical protein